jgi:hypothetical protein
LFFDSGNNTIHYLIHFIDDVGYYLNIII